MKRALTVGIATALASMAGTPGAFAAAPEYESGTVIVKYADEASGRERLDTAARSGVVRTLRTITGTTARLVRVNGDPAVVARRLNASAAVAYAEPNYIARTTAIPNDARFGELYGLHNTGQTGGTADADIDAPEGWDALGLGAFPGALSGAKIGIVDTGVLAGHEDLSGKVYDCAGVKLFGIDILGLLTLPLFADPTLVPGRCADDNGHGTHVAGTAAAKANNGRGVAGVAFNSPLAICKGLDGIGAGGVAGISNCITYLATTGAKVISMSLGTRADSTTLHNAITSVSQSALIVAASGNGGNSAANYPAFYDEVVSVAATDSRDQKASFSTFNADVEVAAPGVGILSTSNDGGYTSISGTSMATPHAAGVAAVIAGRYPGGGPALWRAKLRAATDDLLAPGRDPQTGFGRVNLLKAATG